MLAYWRELPLFGNYSRTHRPPQRRKGSKNSVRKLKYALALSLLLLSACAGWMPDLIGDDPNERMARQQYETDQRECRRKEDYQACMKQRGWRM